jgi:hypothetical protein
MHTQVGKMEDLIILSFKMDSIVNSNKDIINIDPSRKRMNNLGNKSRLRPEGIGIIVDKTSSISQFSSLESQPHFTQQLKL